MVVEETITERGRFDRFDKITILVTGYVRL